MTYKPISKIEETNASPFAGNAEGDVVVSVRDVSKKFCKKLKRSMIYGIIDLSHNMMGKHTDSTYLRKDEFWAIRNLSFELKRGDVLGLIGVNGSGKTTLLRLLAGIFPPDKGEIQIKGRVGALIAVGAGFHPHMTGRENIYLNGTILGMDRNEIDSKFQDIVDFAEIHDFLDAPISTYSSTMDTWQPAPTACSKACPHAASIPFNWSTRIPHQVAAIILGRLSSLKSISVNHLIRPFSCWHRKVNLFSALVHATTNY